MPAGHRPAQDRSRAPPVLPAEQPEHKTGVVHAFSAPHGYEHHPDQVRPHAFVVGFLLECHDP